MDFPVRQAYFGVFESFAPGHHVFINAVNKRAIKIEEKWWDALSSCRLGDYTNTAVILRAAKPAVTAVLHRLPQKLSCEYLPESMVGAGARGCYTQFLVF